MHLGKFFEIKWNSNFPIVHFENFGQPLEVYHFFRNVGITGNFLFHLTVGNSGNSIRNFCPNGSRASPRSITKLLFPTTTKKAAVVSLEGIFARARPHLSDDSGTGALIGDTIN